MNPLCIFYIFFALRLGFIFLYLCMYVTSVPLAIKHNGWVFVTYLMDIRWIDLVAWLISSEEIMVQPSQLSEAADSGTRMFEEQPQLEESFTIHLGTVLHFLCVIFLFTHDSLQFNKSAIVLFYQNNCSFFDQEPNWRRCTTCAWFELTFWTSVNTGNTAAVEPSWDDCRRPFQCTLPHSVGWCCWSITGSTPTVGSREVSRYTCNNAAQGLSTKSKACRGQPFVGHVAINFLLVGILGLKICLG